MAKLDTRLRSSPTMGADDEKLTVNLGLRITEDDFAKIEALADKITVLGRQAIARQALRIGLRALEVDPTLALGLPDKPKKK